MTVAPVSGHTGTGHPRLAWLAVGTAAVGAVMVATGLTTLGLVGFSADDEAFDNWKGTVVGVGLFGGTLVALAASVLAVVEKIRHDHWALLWFPLLFGPAVVVSFPFWFE